MGKMMQASEVFIAGDLIHMLAAIARTARMAATSAPTASPHQVAFGGVSPMPSTSRISHPGGIARPHPIPEPDDAV